MVDGRQDSPRTDSNSDDVGDEPARADLRHPGPATLPKCSRDEPRQWNTAQHLSGKRDDLDQRPAGRARAYPKGPAAEPIHDTRRTPRIPTFRDKGQRDRRLSAGDHYQPPTVSRE